MKTIYRIYSKTWLLNMIAIFMLLFTLQMIVFGIMAIAEEGIIDFWYENSVFIIFFLLYLLLEIWILTATFLPIIKINKNGIFAYSLFWKRMIKWEEIQAVKLLKMNARGGRSGPASASFELTKQPEKKNAFSNKGLKVATFIIISKSNKSIKSFIVSYQLLTHRKMTKPEEIAFEYDEKAWILINEKIEK